MTGAGERIVAVVSALLLLTPMLEGWGLRVSAAADADEALDTLGEEERCLLVLVSADVPAESACATIKAIRSESRFKTLPIVAMEPEAGGHDCLQAGADALLERPVRADRLKALLERFLASEVPQSTRPTP